MEYEPSLEDPTVASISLRGRYFRRKCCRSALSGEKWLKNKGAIIVIMWSLLCFIVYHFFTFTDKRDPIQRKLGINPAWFIGTCFLLPIGGWLADAYLGRYRVICYGMWTMWLGAMLNGFSFVVAKVVQPYGSYGDAWVTLISKLIMGAGLAMFQANIIQFGIDQLLDASSTEIKTFIVWYTSSTFICGIVLHFSVTCTQEQEAALILLIGVSLSLALISTFFLSNWLMRDQITNNPLQLISKVVYFTLKSKLKRHSNIHFRQHGFLSKLNVAKTIHNGPFTSNQVEDVKTFFRVILVVGVLSMFSGGFPMIDNLSVHLTGHFYWPNLSDNKVKKCYQKLFFDYSTYTITTVVVLGYQMLIHPLFSRFIPKVSITKKFIISLLFFFAGALALLGIESASYNHQFQLNNTIIKCGLHSKHHIAHTVHIDVWWMLIPKLLNGFSFFLLISSSIEFICAQAPFGMKGLIFGLTLALYGFSSLIQAEISITFIDSHIWKNAPLSCEIWYFMMQGLITLVGLVVVVVIVKSYKKRTRMDVTSQSDWQESDSYTE